MSAPTRTPRSASARAIEAFARAAGYEIVDSYYDEAVSGADPVTSRSGFAAMMERIASNGVRTIIVETANRFARDLIVQETGYTMLKERGIELIAADKPDAFLDDTPTANLIRQVLGAVSQFEKAMVVTKLKGARDRKRATGVKVEGRKNYAEISPADGRSRQEAPALSGQGQAPVAAAGRQRTRRDRLRVEHRHALHGDRYPQNAEGLIAPSLRRCNRFRPRTTNLRC